MPGPDDQLTVRETADRMGVSPQRVRQLLQSGDLPGRRTAAGWLVPERDVRGREQAPAGRRYTASTAWAAIALLADAAQPESDGCRPRWTNGLHRRTRYRVRRLLAELPDPVDAPQQWRRLLTARGSARRHWVHPGLLERLSREPTVNQAPAAVPLPTGDGLTASRDELVLYASTTDGESLIRRYRLRDDHAGQILLVLVPDEAWKIARPAPGQPISAPAAAAHLLSEVDPRAQDSALRALRYWLARARERGWLADPATDR